MTAENLILKTDSYKVAHWEMYPPGTERVYSYFESRVGAKWPVTLLFGLQYIIKRYLETPITDTDINEAGELFAMHFGSDEIFNRAGWQHIVDEHGGYLPLEIKAVPEGTPVPPTNVLMTVENTDPVVPWLTNYIESLLTHVWYSSNVATLSHVAKKVIGGHLRSTTDSDAGLPYMLHDFGYRGATTDEAARIGGAGHLISFVGTDTIGAMDLLVNYYAATLDPPPGFSVPATEHSVMTSLGEAGEEEILDRLLKTYPAGILSVVADSYDIYEFTEMVARRREEIMERDGVFVLRPDSVTHRHTTPEALVVALLQRLQETFPTTVSSKGYRTLDPHIRLLWGDGIDLDGINTILIAMRRDGFASDNMATFGMGGGLLQKHNRDTQRAAFKSSAQERGGIWYPIRKRPLDESKASKAGRLKLIRRKSGFATVAQSSPGKDLLRTVFLDGRLRNEITFDEVRENARS